MKQHRSRARWALVVSGGVVALAAGVVMAEDLYIQQDRADVTEEPNVLSGVVQTVPRGQRVQSLAREDNWVQVRTDAAKQGYVQDDAVSKTEVAVVAQKGFTGNLDNSLAGKGNLAGEAITYSKNRNYNNASLQKILTLETGSSELGKRFDQFCKSGHVGKYKNK